MNTLRTRELTIAIVMLLAGIAYLLATSQVPRRQSIDAATVPYVLGTLMCLLGAIHLRSALKIKADDAKAKDDEIVDYATTAKTVALILAYVGLMEVVGFPLMSVVYLFVQFIVLTPARNKPNYVLYAVIAVVSTVCIYALFRYAFDLILPVGFLPID